MTKSELDDLLARNSQLKVVQPTGVRHRTPVGKQATRSAAGKVGRDRGLSWESEVEAENAQLRKQGRAVVAKLEPKITPIKKNGKLTVIYSGKGGCDWIGVADGLPVAFETKAVSNVDEYSVLKKDVHQLDFVRDFSGACGKCVQTGYVGYYIYWRISNEKRFHHISTISERKICRLDGTLVERWIDASSKGKND